MSARAPARAVSVSSTNTNTSCQLSGSHYLSQSLFEIFDQSTHHWTRSDRSMCFVRVSDSEAELWSFLYCWYYFIDNVGRIDGGGDHLFFFWNWKILGRLWRALGMTFLTLLELRRLTKDRYFNLITVLFDRAQWELSKSPLIALIRQLEWKI